MNKIEQRPASPKNYTKGRAGKRVTRVVCHVQDGNQEGTAAWFANPASSVSAHYSVALDGRIYQHLSETDAGWHAGNWMINLTSIGVEHEGQPSKGPWTPTEAQLVASAELVAGICRRWGITPDAATIIPHSIINPRHNCPGPTWPWARYLEMVKAELGGDTAHKPGPDDKRVVRIFDPATNEQVGTGSLIIGTDKVYLSNKDVG